LTADAIDWPGKHAISACGRANADLAQILLALFLVVAALPTPVVEGNQEELFPDGVVLVTSRDSDDAADLFPEELQGSRAQPCAQARIRAGRCCAREALAILRGPCVAIPMGPLP